MPDDSESSATFSSTQQFFDHGPRTPAIEDHHHPLNVWNSGSQSGDPRIHERFDEHYTRLRQRGAGNNPDLVESQRLPDEHGHLPWRERIRHTTWAYFTLTMATGGLANVMHAGKSMFMGNVAC